MQGLYAWGMGLPAGGLYAFIFLWLFVESTGFPISDEPLLLLAGYLTTQHRLHLALVLAVALLGKVAASCVAYAIGRRLELRHFARPSTPAPNGWARALAAVRPTPAMVQAVEARFSRQGVWAVFLGRLVPVVRSFISYPAGAARMPFGRFLLATTAGSLCWITLWTLLGAAIGRSYEAVAQRWGSLSWLVLLAVLVALGAIYLIRTHRPRGNHEPASAPEDELSEPLSRTSDSGRPSGG